MENDACPRCGKGPTIAGTAGEGYFLPDGIPWLRHLLWRFGQSVAAPIKGQFRACLGCGLVWSTLAPERLRAVLEREGMGHLVGESDTDLP